MSKLRSRQRACFRLAHTNPAFRPPCSVQVRFTSSSASPSPSDVAPKAKPQPPRKNHASQIPAVPNPSSETLYTLSLHVSPTLFNAINRLRQTYFPRHLNRLDAHLTLFHALPLSHLHGDIIPLVIYLAAATHSYHIRAESAKRIGRGVILPMHHSTWPYTTTDLHRQMQQEWSIFLSKQDQQNPSLHWTVMNKVGDAEKVKRVENEVNEWLVKQRNSDDDHERQSVAGWATGLTIWRYDKGRWVDPMTFDFRGKDHHLREEKNADAPDPQPQEPDDDIADFINRDIVRRQRRLKLERKRADYSAAAANQQATDKEIEGRMIDLRQQADEWLRRQKALAGGDDYRPGNVVKEQLAEIVADPKPNLSNLLEQAVIREAKRSKEAGGLSGMIKKGRDKDPAVKPKLKSRAEKTD